MPLRIADKDYQLQPVSNITLGRRSEQELWLKQSKTTVKLARAASFFFSCASAGFTGFVCTMPFSPIPYAACLLTTATILTAAMEMRKVGIQCEYERRQWFATKTFPLSDLCAPLRTQATTPAADLSHQARAHARLAHRRIMGTTL